WARRLPRARLDARSRQPLAVRTERHAPNPVSESGKGSVDELPRGMRNLARITQGGESRSGCSRRGEGQGRNVDQLRGELPLDEEANEDPQAGAGQKGSDQRLASGELDGLLPNPGTAGDDGLMAQIAEEVVGQRFGA